MTLGTWARWCSQNVKRLLAYSSIAHAGYLLVAFAGLPQGWHSGQRMVYTAHTRPECRRIRRGSVSLAGAGERFVTLDDYAGLGRPIAAARPPR